MTISVDRPLLEAESVTVTPVLDGDRPIGAWVTGPDTAVYRPVVDLTRLAGAALAAVGAVAIATAVIAAATGRRPAVGAVTMGPGGWVSVKGAARPQIRTRRPLWARLIGAEPIKAGRSRRHGNNGPAAQGRCRPKLSTTQRN